MTSNRNSSSGRQIIVLIGVLILACMCLVTLTAAAYFLFIRPSNTGNNNPDVTPEIIAEENTPDAVVSPGSTETIEATSAATSTPEPSLAPATLPAVTMAVTEIPTSTPSPSPTPVEEPTLFVTDTPSPTATASSGGVGIPAPRLVNHTNCQNSISEFPRNGTIEFQWTWTQRVDSGRGYYLEVRIGPRGASNLSSQGGLGNEVLVDPAQNLWRVQISVSNFYQDTANDYEWQVAYMNNNRRLVVASGRGCFNIR